MASAKFLHDQSLLDLGTDFSVPVVPAPFAKLKLRYLNHSLADELGLSRWSEEQWLQHMGRFEIISPQQLPEPLAMKYHGHQFRHYNPDLGDGRGFTFAQWRRQSDQTLFELGTKGSGQTPYSRAGDGRLTLKGAMREALCTAMLKSQQVDTSQTLCFMETGEHLERGDEPSPTRAAVLVRFSRGHIRIGSFERCLYLQKPDWILKLARYSLQNFYPQAWQNLVARNNLENNLGNDLGSTPEPDPLLLLQTLFSEFMQKAIATLASHMLSGFVHGVLNSDNINISGESFDYGPYRFLPHYDVNFTAAYFDREGLYCYGRQPESYHWNIQRLAETFQYAHSEFSGAPYLEQFAEIFNQQVTTQLLNRLALSPISANADKKLVELFFASLESTQKSIGFAEFFYHTTTAIESHQLPQELRQAVRDQDSLIEFFKLAQAHSDANASSATPTPSQMQSRPKLFATCPLIYSEIERVWEAIASNDDWEPFNEKLKELSSCDFS